MNYERETFIGSGRVLFGGFYVGNVTELTHTVEKETKSVKARSGGGNYDSLTQVTGLKLAMKVSDFNDANLALALQALKIDHAGGSQTETVKAIAGGIVPLDFTPNGSTAYVVTSLDTLTTYVLATDYKETAIGIEFLATGAIVAGESVLVTYTSIPVTALEALAAAQVESTLVVEGLNDANNSPFTSVYHRFKIEPMGTMSPFSDDFGTLELNGDALADDSKGVGESKFMRMIKTPSVKTA